MKLIIAEKKSVAAAIAEALGCQLSTGKTHYENRDYLIGWARGHLLKTAEPDSYGDYKKWRLEDLPIVPQPFQYQPIEDAKPVLSALQKLMARSDVNEVICGTDADREGELIFRLIYNACHCNKPVQRLWLDSLEPAAIQSAMKKLRPGAEYDSLYHAAVARQQADWLVGINFSRYYTVAYNSKLSVGRVQTPTLQLIADRDDTIHHFDPKPYYTLCADLGEIKAYATLRDKDTAGKIAAKIQDQEAYITSVKQANKIVPAPHLFSLTTLRKEANTAHGFTALKTLELAQSLYEKKLISYPRTDSQYITDDINQQLGQTLLTSQNPLFPELGKAAGALAKQPIRMIADNKKVTAHYAIIPTARVGELGEGAISPEEKKLLELIVRRTVQALSPDAAYKATTILFDINGECFKATCQTDIDMGWKSLDTTPSADDVEDTTQQIGVNYKEGDTLHCVGCACKTGCDKPPAHFTDGSLPEYLEKIGLGTTATHQAIIETLIGRGYVERSGKKLIATERGRNLLSVVASDIKSPAYTAKWEQSLTEIVEGKQQKEGFISGISSFVSKEINQGKNGIALMGSQSMKAKFQEGICDCPQCEGKIVDDAKSYHCDSCDVALWKEENFFKNKGKTLTKEMAALLLQGKKVKLYNCISSKTGKPYNASIALEFAAGKATYRIEFENRINKGSALRSR